MTTESLSINPSPQSFSTLIHVLELSLPTLNSTFYRSGTYIYPFVFHVKASHSLGLQLVNSVLRQFLEDCQDASQVEPPPNTQDIFSPNLVAYYLHL